MPPNKKYKNSNIHTVWDVTKEIFSSIGGKNQSQRLQAAIELDSCWKGIVGKIASKNCNFAELKEDGVLVIEAISAAWMNELRMLQKQILRNVKLKTNVKCVKKLKFRLMSKNRDDLGANLHRTGVDFNITSVSKRDEEKIRQVTQSIEDSELKNTLERLYKKSIKRRGLTTGGTLDE